MLKGNYTKEVVTVVLTVIIVCLVYLALGLWVIAMIFPTPQAPTSGTSPTERNPDHDRPTRTQSFPDVTPGGDARRGSGGRDGVGGRGQILG